MGANPARGFAVALAVSLLGARAFAFPSSRLTYTRGPGAEVCPGEPSVRQAVASRLGYDPFFVSADKTIVTRIVRVRDELRASVELVDDRGLVRGVREFTAPATQCDELVATIALAISIAIDPTNPGLVGGAPPKPAPSKPQPPPKRPAPAVKASLPSEPIILSDVPSNFDTLEELDAPEEPDKDKGPPASFELRAGAALIGAFGTAPATTGGFGLSAGIRRGIWSFSGEGRAELPASANGGTGSVQTSLWAVAVVPCLHFDPVLFCASAWLGSQRARGVGYPTSRTDHTLYAASGLRLGIELPLTSRLTFRPEFDVLGNFFPVVLNVDGVTQWRAGEVAALLGARLVARFP